MAFAQGSAADRGRGERTRLEKKKTRETKLPGHVIRGILAQRTTGCASISHVVAVGLSGPPSGPADCPLLPSVAPRVFRKLRGAERRPRTARGRPAAPVGDRFRLDFTSCGAGGRFL